MLKSCICCLWCLEKCLAYLNQVSDNTSDLNTAYEDPASLQQKLSCLIIFRTLTPPQPSTAPVSARQPGMRSLSWWRMRSELQPLTLWAILSSSWERYCVCFFVFLNCLTDLNMCLINAYYQMTMWKLNIAILCCILSSEYSDVPLRVASRCSLIILLSSFPGYNRLRHSFCWCSGSELPAGLHRVGAATFHRLCVRLPGGPLLPFCIRECGRRSLPLLCCGHKV